MREVASEIKKLISGKEHTQETPFFGKKGFEAVPISKEYFHALKKNSEAKKICFVDGGNAEVVGSSELSLQLIRTASVIFTGNKRTFAEKKEFFLLITFREGKYFARKIPGNEELNFDINDESLRDGKAHADISRIGSFARRIAELEAAASAAGIADFIVIDGSLEEKFPQEKKFLEKLYLDAEHKKTAVCALSKTNTLLTENGTSVPALLKEMNPGMWLYHPVAKISSSDFKANMCFAKLHEKSAHVFRIDAHNCGFAEICGELSKNSTDPVFPGYPYGLIQADSLARISNKEKEYLRTRLMAELGADWARIKDLESAKNAHGTLDNIS